MNEYYEIIKQHLEFSLADIKDMQQHNIENSNDMFIKKKLADTEFKLADTLKLLPSILRSEKIEIPKPPVKKQITFPETKCQKCGDWCNGRMCIKCQRYW